MERLIAAGRAAWPKVTSDEDAFAAHVTRHAPTEEAQAALHASDLYLAFAVSVHDRAALTYFEGEFMARVPDYVLRVRIGREVVDEVQQKLRETLIMGTDGAAPKIAEYSGRGALGGWLRVAAVRTALNQVRGIKREEEAGEELSLAGDPELAYVKEHASQLLGESFQKVIGELDASARTILRLHYIEGLTMDQLAKLYKTPRSTIARRVAETRERILAATESLLQTEKRLSPSAVESVIRQARSRLDVTVTRLLR